MKKSTTTRNKITATAKEEKERIRNIIEAQGGRKQATVLFRQQINENDNNKQNEIDVMISTRSYNFFFPVVMNFIVFHSVVSFLLQFK